MASAIAVQQIGRERAPLSRQGDEGDGEGEGASTQAAELLRRAALASVDI